MPPLRRLASILFCSMTAEFFQIFDFQKKNSLYGNNEKKNNLNSSLARSIVHTTTLYLLI